MCQKYGAESGDAPGWLKMTPVLRSEDELETYMSVVHAYVPSPEPKSYRSESWKQKASVYYVYCLPGRSISDIIIYCYLILEFFYHTIQESY